MFWLYYWTQKLVLTKIRNCKGTHIKLLSESEQHNSPCGIHCAPFKQNISNVKLSVHCGEQIIFMQVLAYACLRECLRTEKLHVVVDWCEIIIAHRTPESTVFSLRTNCMYIAYCFTYSGCRIKRDRYERLLNQNESEAKATNKSKVIWELQECLRNRLAFLGNTTIVFTVDADQLVFAIASGCFFAFGWASF